MFVATIMDLEVSGNEPRRSGDVIDDDLLHSHSTYIETLVPQRRQIT